MDLNLGQAGWNKIFKRLGPMIRIWSWLKNKIREKMIGNRKIGEGRSGLRTETSLRHFTVDQGTTMFIEGETLNPDGANVSVYRNFTSWSLAGVIIGSNTDDLGRIWCTWTKATQKMALYSDEARTSKIAEGTATGGDEQIVTLAEQNSSGVSGSMKSTDPDKTENEGFIIHCRPDWKERIIQEFNEETAEDRQMRTAFMDKLNTFATTISSLITNWEILIEDEFILKYLKKRIKSVHTDALSVLEEQSDGTVTSIYGGILRDLKDAMEDDTTPQSVLKNRIKADAFTADPDNVGAGSIALTLLEHAKSGVLTLECVVETIGSEQFEVKWTPDEWWDFGNLTAAFYAYVEKEHKDNTIGIGSMTISRTLNETNDDQNIYANWSISGETEDNTDNGKLYVKFEQSGYITKLYKSSDRQDADLVAQGSGTGTIALTEQNGSGLSGSVEVTADIYSIDDSDIFLHSNPFKIGDRFSTDIYSEGITNEVSDKIPVYHGGNFQRYFAEVYNLALPSGEAGTILDSYASRG